MPSGRLPRSISDASNYVRLLSQVPAITEVSELDKDGREQLNVSRLAMDVIGSGQDLSQTPAFTQAKARKVWFSPGLFPRKESEPYMTLAVARAGLTVAEVNLKLIWDVIDGLKIGRDGYAYVVDGRGKLIAHPDISLVLRDTDFHHLAQVAAALSTTQAAAANVSIAQSIGRTVLRCICTGPATRLARVCRGAGEGGVRQFTVPRCAADCC